MPTPVELIKRKRQVRDLYNKCVHDMATINKVAEVIQFPGKPSTDVVNVAIWPDGTWCFEQDIESMSWKSDDFTIKTFNGFLTDEEIDTLVVKIAEKEV